MIICSQPECQTTAGCTCTNRLFDYSRLRGEVAALKKQVEELTAERDDARRYAVEARLRENQAEDRRVSESFARTKAEIRPLYASPLPVRPITDEDVERRFKLDDRVTKTKGSSWTGRVVGFYSTTLTPIGYAVESENEPGSVQIYPEAALDAAGGRG